MKRTAESHWNGNVMEGKGEVTTQSTLLNHSQYSFKTRFADGIGTNPEELLAAAHSACFTMAVSAGLMQAGYNANDLTTKATVTLDTEAQKISSILLELKATPISGLNEEVFSKIANEAKTKCPLSIALSATPISLSISYL